MKKVLRFLSNKFFIATTAFVVWMYFFDQNDWVARRERNKNLRETKANIEYLNQEIATMEKQYQGLTSDAVALEKFAREQYRMKRDNEDLYVVE